MIEIGQGIDIGQGVQIGPFAAIPGQFITEITEDFLVTETGDNFEEE